VLRVHQDVPNSVQFISTVVERQSNGVGTLITGRVGLTVLSLSVKRLVDVSNVVDQEAQSVRLGKVRLTGVKSVLNVVVHITVKILFTVVTDAEPLDNSLHAISQVVLGELVAVVLGIIVGVPCFSLEVEV